MSKKHIPISIISFSVLLIVQYLLIYNTFILRNNQYQVLERKNLDSSYRAILLNDKLFVGGQSIIDSLIKPAYTPLKASVNKPKEFDRLSELFCDTLFRTLRLRSNMDSVFESLLLQHELSANLAYRLVVTDFEITFDGRTYFKILNGKWKIGNSQPYLTIDGSLDELNKQNLITSVTVSSSQANSYKIAFSLYADDIATRFNKIIWQMGPTLLLSFLAISLVIGMYYLTYRNWIRQKKMTEMTSDFLNSITHEFHTPITTIVVANRNIENLDTGEQKEKIKEFTAIIDRQSSRLQKLVKQALNITELNQYNLEKESYNIFTVLSESVNDYRLSLDKRVEIELINESSFMSKEMTFNKFLFTTAIYNIFENAVKYNRSPVKRIVLKIIEKNGELGIQIEDNGIGIKEKQFESVFQKFYRGRESNYIPGLGLGLFYVKKVAEAHCWRLEVRSFEDMGTTFTIWIK
ncbi:sensor histidine kinase [Sphingobacterium sp. LRF_L2]|uniref:sensor histidine kinase n=1 Tax=Sphingobacterium sp. LRF_L2 TaxID=3369421 RepID=UPI003F5F2B1A